MVVCTYIIWMLTSCLSWDVPNNAALFGGPTVWQLAVWPDGLAAHPNISLCCIQRPFQEGWQQKCMLEINSLVISFQGKAWNCMKAPPELQMLWLEVLIRSVNCCKAQRHRFFFSVCKGTERRHSNTSDSALPIGFWVGSSFQHLLAVLESLILGGVWFCFALKWARQCRGSFVTPLELCGCLRTWLCPLLN